MSRNNFFEPLESRQLRSVSLGGGVLTVTGTNNADAITFELDKIGSGMVYRSELVVNDNGAVSRFSLSSTLPGAQINFVPRPAPTPQKA